MKMGLSLMGSIPENERNRLRYVLRAENLKSQPRSVAFSPDGRHLACGEMDGVIQIWNLDGPTKYRNLIGHNDPPIVLAFTPEHQRLLSGCLDGTVGVWDMESGTLVQKLSGHKGPIFQLRQIPAKDIIITSSRDTTIYRRMTTLETVKIINWLERDLEIYDVQTSPNGNLAVISTRLSYDHEPGLHRAEDKLYMLNGEYYRIEFNPNGDILAASTAENHVRLWDLPSGEQIGEFHASVLDIFDMKFSPDGSLLLIAGIDGRVRFWEVPGGQLIQTIACHIGWVYSVDFNSEGRILATCGSDKTTRLWEVPKGKEIATLTGVGTTDWVVTTPQGLFEASPFALTSLDAVKGLTSIPVDQVKDHFFETDLLKKMYFRAPTRDIHDLENFLKDLTDETVPSVSVHQKQSNQAELLVRTKPAGEINSLAFSPNGKILACTGGDHNIDLWDVLLGIELRTLTGHKDAVTDVAFSSNGELLASGSLDGTARVWETNSGRLLHTLPTGLVGWPIQTYFIDQDKILLSVNNDGNLKYWQVRTGREVLFQANPQRFVDLHALSKDGRWLAQCHSRGSVTIWDLHLGIEEVTFTVHEDTPGSVCFHPDGKRLAIGGATTRQLITIGKGGASTSNYPLETYALKLWDISGNLQREFLGHTSNIKTLAFHPVLNVLASGDSTGEIILWDVESVSELRRMKSKSTEITALAFSPDGKTLVAGEKLADLKSRITVWGVEDGEEWAAFERHIGDINPVVFSTDGRIVAAAGEDGIFSLWQLGQASGPQLLKGHTDRIFSLAFTKDDQILVSGCWDGTIRLWDGQTGKPLGELARHDGPVRSIAIDREGKKLASCGHDRKIRFFKIPATEALQVRRSDRQKNDESLSDPIPDSKTMVLSEEEAMCLTFHPNKNWIAIGYVDKTLEVWDFAADQVIWIQPAHDEVVYSVKFSPNGRFLASGSFDQKVKLWDAETGRLVFSLEGHYHAKQVYKGTSVDFRPDGRVLASGGADGQIKFWATDSGKEIASLEGHAGSIAWVSFNQSGQMLAAGANDAAATLWDVSDVSSPRLICTLYSFRDGHWAVIDPHGRFDASNAGDIPWMHWVVGLEPIALYQLKERYYEPGLLPKLFGYSSEPLRDVPTLKEVDLFPEMELVSASPNETKIHVRLFNRGGGIGKVTISINGKEVTADARGASFNPQAQEEELEFDFSDHPFLIPGERNTYEVKAYNSEGYLVSRSLTSFYQAPAKQLENPHLWAIVVGTSNYQGTELDLRFAAKDAVDMANALQLGAKKLFGADKVHLTLLTAHLNSTLEQKRLSQGHSTRRNIVEAFEAAKQAKSTDILVIYLAGHGVNQGGQDGDYYYLTADARTGNLEDTAVRHLTAISSQELSSLIQQIAATKQVLILDTCAAARLVEKLTEQRTIPSSQLRALDRLKDRMGLHILAGSAADAVSYESSRYGQGLLTYSLLLGMRGAALREEEFIDIDRLFEYATDQVPQLAKDIGGIQRPVVATPRGGASFDIGQLAETDKQQIPVAHVIPLVLRANFQDEFLPIDHLGITKIVNRILRERSALGRQANLVFVDSDEFPGAWTLAGRYRMEGDKLSIAGHLFQNGQLMGDFAINSNRESLEAVAVQVVEALEAKI